MVQVKEMTKVEFLKPFVSSAASVFSNMLLHELIWCDKPYPREMFARQFDVTSVVSLAGQANGMLAVSMPKETALSVTGLLLHERPRELNVQVVDAVSELTKGIADGAKSQLEPFHVVLGLPLTIFGRADGIGFPAGARPSWIPFSSSLGPLAVGVGIDIG